MILVGRFGLELSFGTHAFLLQGCYISYFYCDNFPFLVVVNHNSSVFSGVSFSMFSKLKPYEKVTDVFTVIDGNNSFGQF